MGLIRNLLALLGLAAIAVMIWVGPTVYKYKVAFDGFDPQAFETYKSLGERLIEHENAVGATVWSAKVAEDEMGQLWIYTLDMDLMIYGGKTLPPELLAEAPVVKESMLAILEGAAEGDF